MLDMTNEQLAELGWRWAARDRGGELVAITIYRKDAEEWSRDENLRVIALRRELRCAECDCENGGDDCNWIKSE